jgi:hypothetical protein
MNYKSWSLLIRMILQARALWDMIDVIETWEGEYADDWSAMEVILSRKKLWCHDLLLLVDELLLVQIELK